MHTVSAVFKSSLSGNRLIISGVYFGVFQTPLRRDSEMKTRGSFEPEQTPTLPPACFLTSLQFETLAWCSKLAFASLWRAQTFIHQSVPSHIPPLHLSRSATSLSHSFFPCLLSFPALLPTFSHKPLFPLFTLSPPPLLCLFLSSGRHHLPSWIHVRHTSHAATSDLLRDPGGREVFIWHPPSFTKRSVWSVKGREGKGLGLCGGETERERKL